MQYEINEQTYEWTARVFNLLRKVLRVNVKLIHDDEQIADGNIFLFNHFARFETFIPQYLIYLETGTYSRSIAAGEFFVEGDPFSNYLARVGAIPHDHPDLLPMLGREILHGRKVIVFPEGGMVKDRRVVDPKGVYSVYSRSAMARRKHHTGAAVLALALDAFKTAVRGAHAAGNMRKVEAWAESLMLPDAGALLAAAREPTCIVPANITFYPIRVRGNLLSRGAELLNRGLSRRLSEELLIEGNILLRDTDMDIRLGKLVRASDYWRWWDRKLLQRVTRRIDHFEDAFALPSAGERWDRRMLARRLQRNALRLRDDYMHRMYMGVTVNLSQLASCVVLRLVDEGKTAVDDADFHNIVYLAVKRVQADADVHLHRSLKNPDAYAGVLDGSCQGFNQFLRTASSMGLVEEEAGTYRFLPKLRVEHEFDEIRLENLVEVYANEVQPLPGVTRAVERALAEGRDITPQTLAELRFDDERIAHAWDRLQFTKPRHRMINDQETATENAEPYLLMPRRPRPLGIVLVHGFLASPAELRRFGEKLYALGYPVLGVRLKGHGTSPWDLRERSWQDWTASVRRGHDIMSAFASRVALVGFSTGGALSLCLAAEQDIPLAGVAAVSVPYRFRDKHMRYIPLVHGANRLVRWVSSFEGIMPFRINDSENPHINYRHMPIRALYELTLLTGELDARLPRVRCPVCLLQGTEDPVVDPSGAPLVRELLGGEKVSLTMIPSQYHGIVHRDVGETHATIVRFIEGLLPEPPGVT